MLGVTFDGTDYILVNIYNTDTGTEQIKALNKLHIFFISLNIYQYKQIILVGDFNLFLDTTLEARVDFPCLIKREICSKINWLIYLIFRSLEILIRNDFIYDLYEHEEFFFLKLEKNTVIKIKPVILYLKKKK